MNIRNLKEKRVYSSYTSTHSLQLRGVREGMWRQELKQRLWRIGDLLLMAFSVYFCIEASTNCPMVELLTVIWVLPYQWSKEKLLYRFTYSPVWKRHFLIWSFFFPHTSSLYQPDLKVASTGQDHLMKSWGRHLNTCAHATLPPDYRQNEFNCHNAFPSIDWKPSTSSPSLLKLLIRHCVPAKRKTIHCLQ